MTLNLCFHNLKRLRVSLLPPQDGMVIHRKVTSPHLSPLPTTLPPPFSPSLPPSPPPFYLSTTLSPTFLPLHHPIPPTYPPYPFVFPVKLTPSFIRSSPSGGQGATADTFRSAVVHVHSGCKHQCQSQGSQRLARIAQASWFPVSEGC